MGDAFQRLEEVADAPAPTHFAPSTTRACEAHRVHYPRSTSQDEHHIVPQAWQLFLTEQRKAAGPMRPMPLQTGNEHGVAAPGLWDPRTAALCPTGHRNVHAWIVSMMKAEPVAPSPGRLGYENDPLAYKLTLRGLWTREKEIAYLALCRYVAAGGSLPELRRARLYGYA